jgi:hypothetical protein
VTANDYQGKKEPFPVGNPQQFYPVFQSLPQISRMPHPSGRFIRPAAVCPVFSIHPEIPDEN